MSILCPYRRSLRSRVQGFKVLRAASSFSYIKDLYRVVKQMDTKRYELVCMRRLLLSNDLADQQFELVLCVYAVQHAEAAPTRYYI